MPVMKLHKLTTNNTQAELEKLVEWLDHNVSPGTILGMDHETRELVEDTERYVRHRCPYAQGQGWNIHRMITHSKPREQQDDNTASGWTYTEYFVDIENPQHSVIFSMKWL